MRNLLLYIRIPFARVCFSLEFYWFLKYLNGIMSLYTSLSELKNRTWRTANAVTAIIVGDIVFLNLITSTLEICLLAFLSTIEKGFARSNWFSLFFYDPWWLSAQAEKDDWYLENLIKVPMNIISLHEERDLLKRMI